MKIIETKNYVGGFLFRNNDKEVALVLKNKPAWQKNKLNCIGGKIQSYYDEDISVFSVEIALDAMIREFKEETGAEVTDWREFCGLDYRGGFIHFFMARGDNYILTTTEEEEINWYNIFELSLRGYNNALSNLSWLIPLALDKDQVFATVEDES